MRLQYEALEERSPGLKWQALFAQHWEAYRAWFLSEGDAKRPTYLKSLRMLRQHMPELLSTYEQLVDLAGGSDLAARFLSLYRPPAYISGCSQAVWPDDRQPVLVRNYDYSPKLCEATLLLTRWNGRRVIAVGDCMWGVLDGINDAGLAVSLSFGGRRAVGDGFGVPLILRFVLEFCESADEATEALQRIPTHMSYNVTVLDSAGQFRTVYLAPDRPALTRQLPVATNHQGRVEWRKHAESTASLEREAYLLSRLGDSEETEQGFIRSFLGAPLHSGSYGRGFGTLYTAVYRPRRGEMELRWPGTTWRHSFEKFNEGTLTIRYPEKSKCESPES